MYKDAPILGDGVRAWHCDTSKKVQTIIMYFIIRRVATVYSSISSAK